MPFLRHAAFLFLILLAGCDDRVRQRTEQIRELSAREDRTYMAEAVDRVRHTYWTTRDHSWLGKLPDGSIVRLDAPRAIPAPLLSRLGMRGWQLQLTIASDTWRTYPNEPHHGPFVTVYAITRYSATNWYIRVTQGNVTVPLQHSDALAIRDDLN
ncbi:MAG TPA: hypothetical protein VHY22_14330 [Chthoniobacteraceae bacterium]|jgi:hypothetical protein|nr:hypothetical protein [Chthoniobacteraceae bacterium]